MSDILSDIQNYEMIEPYLGFKPLGPIANIEIQPVKDDGENCAPCAVGEEDFWSVYVRNEPSQNDGFGGVDCVADCSNFTGAQKLADLLGALLGVKVLQP
jgi:hypothetical protein